MAFDWRLFRDPEKKPKTEEEIESWIAMHNVPQVDRTILGILGPNFEPYFGDADCIELTRRELVEYVGLERDVVLSHAEDMKRAGILRTKHDPARGTVYQVNNGAAAQIAYNVWGSRAVKTSHWSWDRFEQFIKEAAYLDWTFTEQGQIPSEHRAGIGVLVIETETELQKKAQKIYESIPGFEKFSFNDMFMPRVELPTYDNGYLPARSFDELSDAVNRANITTFSADVKLPDTEANLRLVEGRVKDAHQEKDVRIEVKNPHYQHLAATPQRGQIDAFWQETRRIANAMDDLEKAAQRPLISDYISQKASEGQNP